jgi:hypothetical protein
MALDPSRVRSREDLAEFLGELARRTTEGAPEIESRSLPSYLEAAAGWVADMHGYFNNRGEPEPSAPDWSLVASIFLAATVYE